MNELDSEIMIGALRRRGLERVEDEEKADLLLFNTCSIRDLAERKVMGKIGKLSRLKKRNPIIGVTGCMAMAKKESLFRKLPNIDFVIGTNNITDLDAVLDEVEANGKQSIRVSAHFEENLDYLIAQRDDPIKAHVSIIRGCDKYCTYCVVPYTRGKEVSRPPEEIEKECRLLAAKGYKEITLLGQNVNSYGKDQPQWSQLFHDLLYRLDKIDGIERIRFMTSHPCDITLNLMEAIRDLPSLCEFVHFPMQAGSSRVLRKMHRMYTAEEYFEKVDLLRQTVPGASIGTDIIVGFPTETEEEFEMTMEAFRKIRYSVAFLYTYSARKGTPAFRWKDDIPEEIKTDRLQRLQALHLKICTEQLQEMIDQEVEVLVEKRNRDEVSLSGRTRCWKKVIFSGDESLIGTLQQARIIGYNHQTLLGERVGKRALPLVG
jgi:tRNA-2-methylthio-N6-dimethylallyladenosine synthase